MGLACRRESADNPHMTSIRYAVGSLVTHPNKPEWGPGKVLDVQADVLVIDFRDLPRGPGSASVKRINIKVMPLPLAQSQTDSDLDARIHHKDAKLSGAGSGIAPKKSKPRAKKPKVSSASSSEETGYLHMNTGEGTDEGLSWEDCRKYGFMLAGGDERGIKDAKKLQIGDKVFAYLNKHGYVGLGTVTAEAVAFKDFVPAGQSKPLGELPLSAEMPMESAVNPSLSYLCAAVDWIKTLSASEAVLMDKSRRGTLRKIKKPELVEQLLQIFSSTPSS